MDAKHFKSNNLNRAKKSSKKHNATTKPSIPVDDKECDTFVEADTEIPLADVHEEAFQRETSTKRSPVKAGTNNETESKLADSTNLELSQLVDNLKKRCDDNSEPLQQPPSKLLKTEMDGDHKRAEMGDSEGVDDRDRNICEDKTIAGILDEKSEAAHGIVEYDEVKAFFDEVDSERDTKDDDLFCGSLQPLNLEQKLSNMQQRPLSASTPQRTDLEVNINDDNRAEVRDKIPEPTALEMEEMKDKKGLGTENLPPKDNNQGIAVVSEISGALYAQKVKILHELTVCDEKENAKSSLDNLYDCREPGDRVVKTSKGKNSGLHRISNGSPLHHSTTGSPLHRTNNGSPHHRSKEGSPVRPHVAGIAAHGAAVTVDEHRAGEEVIYWRQEVIQKHMESYPEGTFNPAYPSETRSFCFTAGFEESALKGDPYSSNNSESNAQKRWKYLNFFSFEKKFFNENGKEIVQNLKIWILPFWTIVQFLTRLLFITIPFFGFNLLVEFNFSLFKIIRRVIFYWFDLCFYCFFSLPVQIVTTMFKNFFSFLFSTVSATAEYTPGGIRIVRSVKENVKKVKTVKSC